MTTHASNTRTLTTALGAGSLCCREVSGAARAFGRRQLQKQFVTVSIIGDRRSCRILRNDLSAPSLGIIVSIDRLTMRLKRMTGFAVSESTKNAQVVAFGGRGHQGLPLRNREDNPITPGAIARGFSQPPEERVLDDLSRLNLLLWRNVPGSYHAVGFFQRAEGDADGVTRTVRTMPVVF